MGKKRSWFAAIKTVFTPHCREKLGNKEAERKSGKEKKKKGFGKLRHGEPSSIEKILGEAERDHNLVFRPPDRSNPSSASPPPPGSLQVTSPRPEPSRLDTPRSPSPKSTSPRLGPPKLEPSHREASSRAEPPRPPSPKSPSRRAEPPILDTPRSTTLKPPSPRAVSPRPEHSVLVQHASATKIQGAFRGYMARRSFRALKGLVRLQGVMRGYGVKRQRINAMKYMQQVVRLQSQIQSRRIKMLENQAQVERDEAKLAASEAGNDDWDDSVLTKEERDARSQQKIDAIIKRERSMAYAYSHKLWKNSPKSGQEFPLWWNKRLPLASPVRSHSQPLRDYRLTPTRVSSSPLSQSRNQHRFRLDNNLDASTPKSSSRSTLLTPSRPIRTGTSRYSSGSLKGQDFSPFKDDGSLTSCPPYPSYMAPTISAKAKVRPRSNPKERVMIDTTPVKNEKRRMSFPVAQQGHDDDMFRWNKGSLLISNSSNYKKSPSSSHGGVVLEKHKTVKSVGNSSFDSTVSMPRKPFNRFV